jgi:hypothetical protein
MGSWASAVVVHDKKQYDTEPHKYLFRFFIKAVLACQWIISASSDCTVSVSSTWSVSLRPAAAADDPAGSDVADIAMSVKGGEDTSKNRQDLSSPPPLISRSACWESVVSCRSRLQ